MSAEYSMRMVGKRMGRLRKLERDVIFYQNALIYVLKLFSYSNILSLSPSFETKLVSIHR